MYYNKKVIMNYDNTIASVFTIIMDVIEPLLYSLHTCDSLITISTKFRLMDYLRYITDIGIKSCTITIVFIKAHT